MIQFDEHILSDGLVKNHQLVLKSLDWFIWCMSPPSRNPPILNSPRGEDVRVILSIGKRDEARVALGCWDFNVEDTWKTAW